MEQTIIRLVLLGIATTMLLAVALILFFVFYQKRRAAHLQQLEIINQQREKELTEAAIKAEEEERGRIAGELHDDVGAMLASVKLNVHQAEEDGQGSDAFQQSHKLIEDTIDRVRKMSRSLQPAMLQHLGLVKALRSFFDMFATSSAIAIHYDATPLPDMDENKALGIYRIVQELVNNTLKHAHAKDIWLQHEAAPDALIFRFTHNGQGITEERFQEYTYKKDATGLKNIVNRLKVLNGSIHFEQNDNLYITIIKIPL